jgi:alpha-beta hydrolase superfamily lysophospholipase
MLGDIAKVAADLMGASAEFTLHELSVGMLQRVAPVQGGTRPVLTIPGFMASDESFSRMRRFLEHQGFVVQGWGLGRNRGLQGQNWNATLNSVRKRLTRVVKQLADEHSAPVSLVGHSLGGVYARELAWHLEGEIDRVITLGSPTIHPYRPDRHNQFVQNLSTYINRQAVAELGGREGLLHWDAERPAMPCVAIHSPIDGFVHEGACVIPDYIVEQSDSRAPRENIRVIATHVGMTVNVWVLLAVADRLVEDRRDWKPFEPRARLPAWLAPLADCAYPRAGNAGRDRGTRAFVEMHQ